LVVHDQLKKNTYIKNKREKQSNKQQNKKRRNIYLQYHHHERSTLTKSLELPAGAALVVVWPPSIVG
jgi:hypothetical protein